MSASSSSRGVPHSLRIQDAVKPAIDFTLALTLLVLFSPLILLVALWIKLDSPGPLVYRGLRVGLRGRRFRIRKFRTMVLNADKIGGPSTADDDPRITRAGKFLRKLKLDELPQLFNVLEGGMSLVGPRPEVPQYVAMFGPEERRILDVRPGITDWASLWNSDEGAVLEGSPDPERTYMERVRPGKIRLQLKYVRERSLWNDARILLHTIATVAGSRVGWRPAICFPELVELGLNPYSAISGPISSPREQGAETPRSSPA